MLRGLRFESTEEAQRHRDAWESRWADTRIHGTGEEASRGNVCRRKNFTYSGSQ